MGADVDRVANNCDACAFGKIACLIQFPQFIQPRDKYELYKRTCGAEYGTTAQFCALAILRDLASRPQCRPRLRLKTQLWHLKALHLMRTQNAYQAP